MKLKALTLCLFMIIGSSYTLTGQCNSDTVCDATETYCNCTDCDAFCGNADAVFVQMLPAIAIALDPIAYCPLELGSTNTSPETVFIPIAAFDPSGDLACVSWLVSPSHGEIFLSTAVDADPASNDGVIADGFIFFLSITDAQIAASPGGITTITYTAQNDPNAVACTFTSQIDWNATILQSDLSTAFVSAGSQCMIICNTDTVCDADENYCSCVDCSSLCSSGVNVFVDMTGPSISTDPIAYCPLERGLMNTTPETVMIALAPLSTNGDLSCITWEVMPSEGDIFVATNPPSDADPASNNGEITDGFIYFLVIDDAGIAASGGITTITYTALNDLNLPACTFSSTIDWNGTILQSDLTPWGGSATALCPDVCTPLDGAFLSIDCITNMVSFDVTDAGTPPAGSDYELVQTNDPSVSPVTVTGTGTFMLGPIDPTVTFSIGAQASNGVGDCDVQTGAIYPDCYSLPLGCTDVLAGTGDMETAGVWVEVSDTTNTVTLITDATAVANIDGSLPLAGGLSAFLGGWGDLTRTSLTSISQSVTFGSPGENASLIFWLQIAGCDSADDLLDISIDGTSVYSTDALANYPMTSNGATGLCDDGHWYEIIVPLGTTYSDGANHTITVTATEAATNGAATAFFIDEMIIESCGMDACPPEYTMANGNRLVGTESGIADYETDGIIESEQTIDATADVDYDSAIEVNLLPGFNTVLGALFDAFIDGCMGVMFDNESQESSRHMMSESVQLKGSKVTSFTKRSIQNSDLPKLVENRLTLSR